MHSLLTNSVRFPTPLGSPGPPCDLATEALPLGSGSGPKALWLAVVKYVE